MKERKYHFVIRENSSGESIRERCWGPWTEGTEFFLTEGNLGCDCNRDSLWREAHGLLEREDSVCLGRGKYTITKIEFDDGEVMEVEW